LHINADDVMILNASFRALLDQLHTLNATLQQEIQMRDLQISELLITQRGATESDERFNTVADSSYSNRQVGGQ
jgi:hypothetical protein